MLFNDDKNLSLDKMIVHYFCSGLSISDISKKMKNTICSFIKDCNKPADVKKYVTRVIYDYQMLNN